jgi:DNA-binding beta-propeller fold protein YncE
MAPAVLGAGPASAGDFYHLMRQSVLPGKAPGWDYLSLDSTHGYLFMGRRHDGVTVFDVDHDRVRGRIERSEGANMATLVPSADRGYTTNGDGSTTVFVLSSLKTLDRVKLGDDADAAYFEPVSGQLAFMRGDSHAITFVDARTAAKVGELHTESDSLEAAAPDGQGHLFISERDRNAVLKVDVAAEKVVAEWPAEGCEAPTGMAYDAADRRIFAGCRGASPVIAVLDAATGKTITTLPIGRGNDGVVYDAAHKRLFASNGIDGNLVVYRQVDADHYALDQAVTTRPMARTMAYDPRSGNVYLVAAQGVVDPSRKVNTEAGPFYPNTYFDNTYTLLTYSQTPAAIAAK